MAGMYPGNQDIEIFGEQVQWPGVDANGKFTNGSFYDPMMKPSFIPAETINLVLDNLERLIEKCGGTPNATNQNQLADLLSRLGEARKIVMRDENGRAQVAAPEAEEDIARLAEITAAFNEVMDQLAYTAARITPNGFGLYVPGRDLMAVLGVSNINDAMAALRARCNGTGVPDFSGLQIGDYLDGIDLSAIPAENGGTAGQPWNNTYKNNRITLSAFNPYKGVGDTEVTKNHVRFDFANVTLRKRMNPTNSNTGGYAATEMRAFLDGVNGDGTGGYTGVTTAAFLNALKGQIGDYILPVRRLYSNKPDWAWKTYSLWLPSENEIFGANAWGEAGYGDGQKLHIPLYQKSYAHRIKRYNGSRDWYFLCTPTAGSAAHF
ncbi:MAG: hypothetical protein LBH57_04530, partial [Treponema sp.]|nr:hypothetical protein [Treponema sp.]